MPEATSGGSGKGDSGRRGLGDAVVCDERDGGSCGDYDERAALKATFGGGGYSDSTDDLEDVVASDGRERDSESERCGGNGHAGVDNGCSGDDRSEFVIDDGV